MPKRVLSTLKGDNSEIFYVEQTDRQRMKRFKEYMQKWYPENEFSLLIIIYVQNLKLLENYKTVYTWLLRRTQDFNMA